MEGEAFNPSPQSSMEREGKQSEDVTPDASSSSTAGAPATWRDMVQTKAQPVMRATAAAQSKFVNHPYVQRSSAYLSSSAGPVVGKAGETVQLGRETARKIYNKEEGYEPAKVAPYFAGAAGVLFLCILLTGQLANPRNSPMIECSENLEQWFGEVLR